MALRLPLIVILSAAVLAGCGDDSQSTAQSAADAISGNSSASMDNAPSISGSPTQKVLVSSRYAFTPVAGDSDGHSLRFSIQNKPDWAQFDDHTGQLTGIPTEAHIGVFQRITIAVSNGVKTASLHPFQITVADAQDDGAPTIDGTPDTSVVAGDAFRFEPSVSDPDGNSLTFNIKNKPSWANFDTTTGELTGKPTLANLGTTEDIVITVSNGTATSSLAAFDLTVSQTATDTGSATLSWQPPTQNTDGSALTDLAGYRIYYGTSANKLDKSVQVTNPGITTFMIENLSANTWYFAVKAYTSDKAESDYSGKVSKTIS